MTQPELDFTAARQRRDEALSRVEANAGEEWNRRAYSALVAYLETHEEFFCDDLWSTGLERPHDSRATGPVILKASKAGLIEKAGAYRMSKWGDHKPVWRSLVYRSAP